MDLTLREVADLLQVTEATVYRWAREGVLPSYRVQDQFRFNRVELQEWAASHDHRVAPQLAAGETPPSLHAALERGGIHRRVAGAVAHEVLRSVTVLPGIPEAADRDLLYELLVRRESSLTSGIGDGIALPHARDPLVIAVSDPVVLLCFLAQPVDFRSVDGKPVRVLFTLLSPSVRAHLQVLAKLAFVLHDAAMKELVSREAPDGEILARVRDLEAGAR